MTTAAASPKIPMIDTSRFVDPVVYFLFESA